MRINYLIILGILLAFTQSCSSTKNKRLNVTEERTTDSEKDVSERKPIIIYKTKANYANLVPVMLSDDKTQIVAYPHPKDVYYNNNLAYPSTLKKGYLLDNMGINLHTAYLNITLAEYSQYEQAPAISDMYAMIIEKNPITMLYQCKQEKLLSNDIDELNKIIKSNFKKCKCLKK